MRYEYEQNKQNHLDWEDNSGRKNQRTRTVRRKHPFLAVAAGGLIFGLAAGSAMYAVNMNAAAHTGSGVMTSVEQTGTSQSGDLTAASAESQDTELTVEQVAEKAMPSMVTISTMSVQQMQNFFGGVQQYVAEGAGSGVIVGEDDSKYYIATNNHVINGADEVSVGFIDESVVQAEVVGADTEKDLAVLAVDKKNVSDQTAGQISVISIGKSSDLALGEQVVAIGNALGYGQSVTSGYVSALDRDLELSDGTNTYHSTGLIQTDAAINSGNSGGALLNMKGELIGINEAKTSSSSGGASVDNMGFAIPMDTALPILQQLLGAAGTADIQA